MQRSENNPDFKGIPGRNEMEALSFSDNPADAMQGRVGLAVMDLIAKEVKDHPNVCLGCVLSTIGIALTEATKGLVDFVRHEDVCQEDRQRGARYMRGPAPRPEPDSPNINIGGKPGRYI